MTTPWIGEFRNLDLTPGDEKGGESEEGGRRKREGNENEHKRRGKGISIEGCPHESFAFASHCAKSPPPFFGVVEEGTSF